MCDENTTNLPTCAECGVRAESSLHYYLETEGAGIRFFFCPQHKREVAYKLLDSLRGEEAFEAHNCGMLDEHGKPLPDGVDLIME